MSVPENGQELFELQTFEIQIQSNEHDWRNI